MLRINAPKRCAATIATGAFIILILYFITPYQKLLFFSVSELHCQFAENLQSVFVESSLHRERFTNVVSLPPDQPSQDTVVGHSTVFYIWCGVSRRRFEFRNYLSVRSVLRTLRPDAVWFYYESEPIVDSRLYNTWWQELIDDVSFFHHQNLRDIGHPTPLNACDGPSRPSADFVFALVTSRGGTFVDESTIVVSRPPDDRLNVAVDSNVRLRLLNAHRGISCPSLSSNGNWSWSSQNVRVFTCPSHLQLNDANTTLCFHVAQSLYPKNIWWSNSTVSQILRLQFYNSADVQQLLPSYKRLAPNVGHVVWIGGGKMNFLFFLCVLSLLHVAKVDVVYIHGDSPPTGIYWNLLMDTGQKVQLVYRENSGQVYGQKIYDVSHVSDVWRADIMLKYGGVYCDTDAVVVRPLSRQLRSYDTVVSFDWPEWNQPFPDILNLGVTVSKPGAQFWKLCLQSMKWFRANDFSWNGLRQPYRVMERHPHLVHVDPHLQVICYYGYCHPTWWPNYHDSSVNHLSPPPGVAPLDWRKDAFAFHFTYPVPWVFRSPKSVLNGDSLYAEIGKMILEAADMVRYFQ